MPKSRRVTQGPQENVYPSSALSHGKTDEILGRVLHSRVTVTITRYGKPIAKIVPIDTEDTVLTDPTSKIPTT